jgi:hypothetical protein
MKSLYVKFRNFFYDGFGECAKCGGNWGWKKYTIHPTSENSGLFLFCKECDKIVTIEERHEALDDWKRDCFRGMYQIGIHGKELEKYIKEIEDTEFIEYPR